MFNESLVRHDNPRSNSGRSCGHQIILAARSNQLRLDLGCDMSGFSKLHSSLTASSLWNEPDKTRIVFITMLSMADSNGDVKASVVGLAHQARESLADTQTALKTLLAPDPHSGRKEMEGRRIVEIEGGWHLVTHEFYRELGMSEETKRYWRERKRALREKKSKNVSDKSRKSRTVKDSLGSLVSVSASDSVKKEEGTRERKPKSVIDCIAYCREVGLTETDGHWLYEKWQSNGFTNGGKPILDWKGTVRTWKLKGDIFPSHKRGIGSSSFTRPKEGKPHDELMSDKAWERKFGGKQ